MKKFIENNIQFNQKQILQNEIAIELMKSGYGTRSRDIYSSGFCDDTKSSIISLMNYNAVLLDANAILRASQRPT
jgi:hypothetical protein